MRRARSRLSLLHSVFARGYRPTRGVSVTPAGGSALVLRSASGRYVSLQGEAGRAWTLLERGASLQTIHRLMRREYRATSACIEEELLSLVQVLDRAGLIERTA